MDTNNINSIPNYNKLTQQFVTNYLTPKPGSFANLNRVLSEHSDYIFIHGVLNILDLTSSNPNGPNPYTLWRNNTKDLRKESISQCVKHSCKFNPYYVNYGWINYEIKSVPMNRPKNKSNPKPDWTLLVQKSIRKGHSKDKVLKTIHKVNDHHKRKHMSKSNFNKLWKRSTTTPKP